MADLTANAATESFLRPAFRSVFSVFDSVVKSSAAVGAFQQLNALSDADLIKMGLARQDLSAYIFRNFVER